MSATRTEQYHGAPMLSTVASSQPPTSTSAADFASQPQTAESSENNHPEYQSPILEEDESNETGSEPAEPLTPTSDAHSHQFHHQNGSLETTSSAMAQIPTSQPEPNPKPLPVETPARQPPLTRKPTNTSEDMPKPGLGKRVGTFMRSKLHRTPSRKAEPVGIPQADGIIQTPALNTAPPKPASPPKPPSPSKSRPLSNFSFTGRKTPPTSPSSSPSSPSSPSSTIASEQQFESSSAPSPYQHTHSLSSNGLNAMGGPRPGITWAGTSIPSKQPAHPRGRRRSASTDMIHKLLPQTDSSDGTTAGLQATISTHAVAGAGLKARRLSTSLPDEFFVDYCELDDEFKSSSLAPGRRGQLLGKGATATVRLMKRKGGASDEVYAVKEFRGKDKNEDEDEYIKKVKSEYSIAKSLHHPNIVETVRLCTHAGKWNHVMEYCPVGEMYSLVEKGLFRTHYTLADRLCFFKQLVRGVDYLHSHGIAHRDIKLENLLMNNDGVVKITDFGVSEVFCGEHPGLRRAGGECGKNMGEIRRCAPGICGSMPYIAPEVLAKEGDYDPRPLDVWSCAIVFLTMTHGGNPWGAAQPSYENYARFKAGWDKWLASHPDGEVVDAAADSNPSCGPVFPRLDNPALKRLMLKMLHPDPQKRISVHDVLGVSYVKNIECCSPESFEEGAKCCGGGIDACAGTGKGAGKKAGKMIVQKRHSHLPPKEHKTPKALQHRFDMGHGWS